MQPSYANEGSNSVIAWDTMPEVYMTCDNMGCLLNPLKNKHSRFSQEHTLVVTLCRHPSMHIMAASRRFKKCLYPHSFEGTSPQRAGQKKETLEPLCADLLHRRSQRASRLASHSDRGGITTFPLAGSMACSPDPELTKPHHRCNEAGPLL